MKTNRRNFIKNISCLLGGVLASISGFISAALPRVSYPKRSGTKFIAEIPQTKTPPWKSLGCRDCYRECRHWDECLAILREKHSIEFNGKTEKLTLPNNSWSHIVGVEFVDKDKEMAVYIDGKKATKLKDGSYRVEA